ncbi:MAG: hypothetical protein JNM93_09995 [Bacteriovoracaceae bacterium]|nr:hypothetical protein [Bacteriovoracaceae bacterium]
MRFLCLQVYLIALIAATNTFAQEEELVDNLSIGSPVIILTEILFDKNGNAILVDNHLYTERANIETIHKGIFGVCGLAYFKKNGDDYLPVANAKLEVEEKLVVRESLYSLPDLETAEVFFNIENKPNFMIYVGCSKLTRSGFVATYTMSDISKISNNFLDFSESFFSENGNLKPPTDN